MKRWLSFGYGVGAHVLFLGTYAWMAGFVGNVLVPKSIDTPAADSWPAAWKVNLALLGLFAVQHSVMARPGFKRWWTRLVPQPIERSTYVVISSVLLVLLMWQWRGMPSVVWNVEQPYARDLLWCLFAVGWLTVPAVTLMIDHFDLFGTRQVWCYLRGKRCDALPFRESLLYRRVRHPLYLGWALAFWATPTMTAGHLLFAGVLTAYMVGAAFIEERDLVGHFGRDYVDYQRRVPMFVPRMRAVAAPRGLRRGAARSSAEKAEADRYMLEV